MNLHRWRIEVEGIVQGVGFRPFVWLLAKQLKCSGWVRNSTNGVQLEVQGHPQVLEQFLSKLLHDPPPIAQIAKFRRQEIAVCLEEYEFRIRDSEVGVGREALLAPDIAVCADCVAELHDPSNRRFGYPFVNCTNCGPRFTIQQSIPYDRSFTTMAMFRMCAQCLDEYASPRDRRFHAQPNACPKCGPRMWLVQGQNFEQSTLLVSNSMSEVKSGSEEDSERLVEKVRTAIEAGGIIAIKGLGGFHLACDAKNANAIGRLRMLKQRAEKPLAVMVFDFATAEVHAEFDQLASELLQSNTRPIVLVKKRGSTLPEAVAPGNRFLGIMLPYTPLHHLLLRPGDVWVMTSGNLANEPIAYDNEDAFRRLGGLADMFLFHDRLIHNGCDDSIVKPSRLGAIPLRCARGISPLSVAISTAGCTVLAVGGEIKSALCLLLEKHAIIGQHLGDTSDQRTLLAVDKNSEQLLALYQAEPRCIAADLHPGYLSVQWARKRAKEWSLPFLQVQHHHAHAASLMAEHRIAPEASILACVFDGAGYGKDGNIWGGELLRVNCFDFERLAHLQNMPLPGGDSCTLRPAKTALAYLHALGLPWEESLSCVQQFSLTQRSLLRRQLDQQLNVTLTSSMGRLFDAVAALLGICSEIEYEGQAAMALEAMAEQFLEESPTNQQRLLVPYPIDWSSTVPQVLSLRPMLKEICGERLAGKDARLIAARFHHTLAVAFANCCTELSDDHRKQHHLSGHQKSEKLQVVGLSGGVFQNRILAEMFSQECIQRGFRVLTHRVVPANDGGLSLGQAVIARCQLGTNPTIQENRG